jgi:hypothetical protein
VRRGSPNRFVFLKYGKENTETMGASFATPARHQVPTDDPESAPDDQQQKSALSILLNSYSSLLP